jgi:thymidylate kinase
MFGMEDQLFLYIAGVAGTGKSYVIKAVVEFFRRCGVSRKLMLSAPTGCAAVPIDGYTIHALTFLPKRKDEKRVCTHKN